MKNPRTFTPATPFIDISQFHSKHSGLNKPGGAGSFLLGGVRVASQPPTGHYFFLTLKLRRYYVHRNFTHRNPPAKPASGSQNGCRRPENPARIVAQPAQSQYLRAFRRSRIGGQSFNVASICSKPIFSRPAAWRG